MFWQRRAICVLAVVVTGACYGGGGGNDGGGGDSCEELSGTWLISGTCVAASCTISQNGCSFTMACDDGSDATGTFDGSSVSFNVSVEGSTTNCSGTLGDYTDQSDDPEVKGTCSGSGETCSYTAECVSGDCTSVGTPPVGSGGTTGSGGTLGSGGTPPVAGTGGSSPAGGTGGSSTLDPTCEAGTEGVCACLEGTEEACTPESAASLYTACVDGLPEAAFIGCFAAYVQDGQIDCTTAANACIEQ